MRKRPTSLQSRSSSKATICQRRAQKASGHESTTQRNAYIRTPAVRRATVPHPRPGSSSLRYYESDSWMRWRRLVCAFIRTKVQKEKTKKSKTRRGRFDTPRNKSGMDDKTPGATPHTSDATLPRAPSLPKNLISDDDSQPSIVKDRIPSPRYVLLPLS